MDATATATAGISETTKKKLRAKARVHLVNISETIQRDGLTDIPLMEEFLRTFYDQSLWERRDTMANCFNKSKTNKDDFVPVVQTKKFIETNKQRAYSSKARSFLQQAMEASDPVDRKECYDEARCLLLKAGKITSVLESDPDLKGLYYNVQNQLTMSNNQLMSKFISAPASSQEKAIKFAEIMTRLISPIAQVPQPSALTRPQPSGALTTVESSPTEAVEAATSMESTSTSTPDRTARVHPQPRRAWTTLKSPIESMESTLTPDRAARTLKSTIPPTPNNKKRSRSKSPSRSSPNDSHLVPSRPSRPSKRLRSKETRRFGDDAVFKEGYPSLYGKNGINVKKVLKKNEEQEITNGKQQDEIERYKANLKLRFPNLNDRQLLSLYYELKHEWLKLNDRFQLKQEEYEIMQTRYNALRVEHSGRYKKEVLGWKESLLRDAALVELQQENDRLAWEMQTCLRKAPLFSQRRRPQHRR